MKRIAAATWLPALVLTFSLFSTVLPAHAATITLDETDPMTILVYGGNSGGDGTRCGPADGFGSCSDVALAEVEGFRIDSIFNHFHTDYSPFITFFLSDGWGIDITRADGGTFTPISASITKRYDSNTVFFNGILEALPLTTFEGPEWQDITRLRLAFGPGPQPGFEPGVNVISLTLEVVPEPSLFVLALIGGVARLRRHQRSRSQSS